MCLSVILEMNGTHRQIMRHASHHWVMVRVMCVCGVWCVVCGVWCVVCGVWCVVRAPCASEVEGWAGEGGVADQLRTGGPTRGSPSTSFADRLQKRAKPHLVLRSRELGVE